MQNRNTMKMKTALQQLCFGIFLVAAFIHSDKMSGQIDYLEKFSTDEHRWTDLDFYVTDEAVYGSDYAFRANPVNRAGNTLPVETVSPSIGISNGEEATLTYNFKLLQYDNVLPYLPLNQNEDWGGFWVQYGPSRNGPWTTLDVILPQDYIPSGDFESRSINFFPPENSDVYLRIVAGGGINPNISYFAYVDEVSVLQKTITTTSLDNNNPLQVYPNPVKDYLNLEYLGTINEVVVYNMQGQQVMAENRDGYLSKIDMSGLAMGTYVVKVFADNRVQSMNIVRN